MYVRSEVIMCYSVGGDRGRGGREGREGEARCKGVGGKGRGKGRG